MRHLFSTGLFYDQLSAIFLMAYSLQLSLDSKKRRKRATVSKSAKKSRKLLPFNPIDDPVRRLEQMASLATALTATGAEFSNELTYVSGMAPRSVNRAVLERDGMQVLFNL